MVIHIVRNAMILKKKCGSCNSNSILKKDKSCEAYPTGQKPNGDQTACLATISCDINCDTSSCTVSTGVCTKCKVGFGFDATGNGNKGSCTVCSGITASDGSTACSDCGEKTANKDHSACEATTSEPNCISHRM